MKLLMATILFISLILLAFCIFKTYRSEHKLADTIRRILIIGWIIVSANMVPLLIVSEKISILAHSVYFAVADWLLYYLLKFSIEFIGNKFEKHVKKKLMIALLAADSISMLFNNVFGHLFYLQSVTLFDGNIYYRLVVKPLFYIHYAIIVMLVVLCLISLFYRAFTAAAFYRRKYMAIAVILLTLAALNAYAFKLPIDISVIGYVVEGICIYYCALVYTPQRLLPKTLFLVAQDMDLGLSVLDLEGKNIFNNTYAEALFTEDMLLMDKNGVTLEQWCQDKYIAQAVEFTEEKSFYRENEEFILKIQLQRMEDEHHLLQGAYFIIQDRTEEINNLKKEKYLATHDSLTDVYNKEYFYEMTRKYLNEYTEEELLMICTDIKGFKMINDFLGTQAGDRVLINFADMLRKQIKEAIIYGRLGNDVFGILMAKANYKEELFVGTNQEDFFAGMEKRVSFPVINYIGIYEITDRTIPVSVMCDRARMAISAVKGDYHKQVAFYDDALRDNIVHEQELISDLKKAIKEEQLKMFLQPQMTADGKLLGAEALVRWVHPEKGMIMPGEFIPVFEKNGLISDVDLFIWEAACKLLRKWKDEGRNDLYVSVNISPKDFYFLNIFKIFTELVEKYEIEPQNIKLEITETAIVMDFKRQMELITRLRKSGFVVEMDDFGSGYSSLNMLKDIHVDVLKIDMAFLRKAEDEDRSRKILQMIISLSKQLGMPVITEGVESAEQVEFLGAMGCEMFQGYYFSRPVEVERFEAMYMK